MTDTPTPKPGELWDTDRLGGVAVKTEDGWRWPSGGSPLGEVRVNPYGDGPVGYTVEHVERLRRRKADTEAVLDRVYDQRDQALMNETEARVTIAERNATIHDLRAERDEAVARAEASEVALADTPTEHEALANLANLAEREPWRVLRSAAAIIDALDRQPADTTPVLVDTSHGPNRWYALRAAAEHLEREHAETAKRDRLIVRAKEVYSATMGHETALTAVVDAVLAEAVDHD